MNRRALIILFVALLPALAAAQTPAPNKGPAGQVFRAEFLANLADVQSKIVSLAEAVPEEKYSWRPGKDVRSVSEVYMHIAGGNYFLVTFVGVAPPADMPEDIEKITEKARVVAALKRSFDHLRNAAMTITDAELDQRVKVFGNQTTHRGVYVTALNHLHEHLGQSIAYARMNGVTPPWSR